MALNPNWPLESYQVAFNAGPADPNALPVWTDLTARKTAGTASRGRQYELDQIQAGEGTATFRDADEVLNPANAASPYAPNVVPYRQVCWQAMWPPAPVGAAVNLLNATAGFDPSFEATAVGATPPWITAVGATSPVVGTTTPRSGSHDLSWTVANGTTVQGASWKAATIPGQQYTASVYVRQSAASTQSIRITDQNIAVDAFNRTTANGWGTADFVGGAWSQTGGSASDYSTVAGSAPTPYGTAFHTHNAVNVVHLTQLGSCEDSNQLVLITVPVIATGAAINAALVSRFIDSSNYYSAQVIFNTDGTVTIKIRKRVAGVNTDLSTATLPFGYTAGSQVWVRLTTAGVALSASAWLDGTAEPSAVSTTATDASLSSAGGVGCHSVLGAATTNTLPVTFAFQHYSAAGSVSGSTTSTTGSYVRLTVTWTATQPTHTLQVATTGTAVAGTVLLDDIQLEPGASASTYNAAGPVVYGVHRGFVERWPSQWNFQGTYGLCQVTTVDVYAALAARSLHAAYRTQLLALLPDNYWPLSEAQGATSFADSTGTAGRPGLGLDVSKYGDGTAPQAGQNLDVPGDPGGTGVKFTPDASPASLTQASTLLGTGPLVDGAPTPLLLPATIGTSWTVTVAYWCNVAPASGDSQTAFLALRVLSAAAVLYYVPVGVNTTGSVFYQNASGGTGFSLLSGGGAVSVTDGKPHLIIAAVTQDATNTTVTKYVDGVQVATNTASTASLGGILGAQASSVIVGGIDDTSSFYNIVNGSLAHLAVWNRALTASEITALWTAGRGYLNEGSGARIIRLLASGGYLGPSIIDAGLSTMGADIVSEGTALLDACLDVALTENGVFWADGAGSITFASRSRRYLTTTAQWTFGENAAGGEAPYESDIAFDYDPTLVFNDIKVTRVGGRIATASDPASQRAYFTRSYQRTINPSTDNEATDAANYLLATHKAPQQRIATLTIKPSANPALWPVALGVEIGDRATVKRRTSAGVTMSGDFFIEQIEHGQQPGGWTVSLQMSPAAWTLVPWILGDATYGVLGSTTVLVY